MKCERCGNSRVWSDGRLMTEASGEDATKILTFEDQNEKLIANVCSKCAGMLRKLGWIESKDKP